MPGAKDKLVLAQSGCEKITRTLFFYRATDGGLAFVQTRDLILDGVMRADSEYPSVTTSWSFDVDGALYYQSNQGSSKWALNPNGDIDFLTQSLSTNGSVIWSVFQTAKHL